MDYIVETNDLTKAYSSKYAVDHVNMHIPQGSIYGFVGENGSGKTTIMRLLMGLALPTFGGYSLFGINNKDKNILSVRKNISAIVEAPSLEPSMTAVENLHYACLYYGIKNDEELVKSSLKTVGLEDTGKKKVKNFSLGMRQRLGIAVLLLNKPTLMLLDEPMNGLDPSGMADLRELILSLNKQGITFLISSHILAELEKVATHYGFISQGKLIKEISVEDLAKECPPGLELKYHDLDKLEKALRDLGYNDLKVYSNSLRIVGENKPLEVLKELEKKGISIDYVRTREVDIEDYYLRMIGGQE